MPYPTTLLERFSPKGCLVCTFLFVTCSKFKIALYGLAVTLSHRYSPSGSDHGIALVSNSLAVSLARQGAKHARAWQRISNLSL